MKSTDEDTDIFVTDGGISTVLREKEYIKVIFRTFPEKLSAVYPSKWIAFRAWASAVPRAFGRPGISKE